MVKNKTGGKNAKRGARKIMNESSQSKKLRVIEDKDEYYGIVTKELGNGQLEVLCMDNKTRLCFIRYKFSGRNKSRNKISRGSWIIVGVRSWETKIPDKMEKCDLIEIYTNSEKNDLIQQCETNISSLIKHEHGNINVSDDMMSIEITSQPTHSDNPDDNSDVVENVLESNTLTDDIIDFDEI